MHQDLLALLEADDAAKQQVADAERLAEDGRRTVRQDRDLERARRREQHVREVDALVRAIEGAAARRAAERRLERDRRREARSRSAAQVAAAGVAAYVEIVRGRLTDPEPGP